MNVAPEAERGEVVSVVGLSPVGRRPPLPTYVTRLWARRHFIMADSRARVASGTRQLILGRIWLVLRPVMDGLVYLLVFGILLQTNRGIENFVGYLLIGVFMFGFTARSLNSGASSIVGGKNLIRAFTFPRVSLPIATALRETLNTLPGVAAMMVLIIVLPPHADVTWRWLLFPLVFTLQVLFNLGISMVAARLVTKIPDLTNVISFLTRFWLYGSAVFFSYDRFIDHPTILALMQVNPLFNVLDITRDILLYGNTPSWHSWAILAAWSICTALGGLIFFWRGEESYGRV